MFLFSITFCYWVSDRTFNSSFVKSNVYSPYPFCFYSSLILVILNSVGVVLAVYLKLTYSSISPQSLNNDFKKTWFFLCLFTFSWIPNLSCVRFSHSSWFWNNIQLIYHRWTEKQLSPLWHKKSTHEVNILMTRYKTRLVYWLRANDIDSKIIIALNNKTSLVVYCMLFSLYFVNHFRRKHIRDRTLYSSKFSFW